MSVTYVVSSQSELQAVLGKVTGGDTVSLKSGSYGKLDLSGLEFDQTVTLRSEVPGGATFTSVDLSNAGYLSVDGIHVDSPSDGDAGSKLVKIENSHHIEFLNSEVNATVDGTTNYADYEGQYGILVKNSDNVTVENLDVHDVRDGVTVIGGNNIEVIGNEFDYLGHDTIKVIGVDGILLENNIGPSHIYAAPKAHKDFIQFGGSDSSNIVIRGNVYLAGNQAWTQGIFMDDATYDNVLIEDNIIYTGILRGISITSGSNIVVRNNTVLDIPDDGHKATIISLPAGSISQNNISSFTAGGTNGSNIVAQHDDPNDDFYYGDLFANAYAGLGITLEDLKPIEGSAAENKGAYDRIMQLLSIQ